MRDSALVPLSGAIIRHAEYFVDPALSFANGWNQVYGTMVSLPAELVAAAVIVEFWNSTNSAVWITVFGLLLVTSNLFFVRIYGELEFTFASLKIMLIIGLNIMVGTSTSNLSYICTDFNDRLSLSLAAAAQIATDTDFNIGAIRVLSSITLVIRVLWGTLWVSGRFFLMLSMPIQALKVLQLPQLKPSHRDEIFQSQPRESFGES
jgi:hypothetical protein